MKFKKKKGVIMMKNIICKRISKKKVPDKKKMFLRGGHREKNRMSEAHHVYTYKGRNCNLVTFISNNGRCTWDYNRNNWIN